MKLNKKIVKEFIFITIGLIFVASGLYFFLVPNELAAGGVSGLAIVINKYIPKLSVPVIMLATDAVLYVLGFIFIGKSFGVKSLYCSILLPTFMTILGVIFPLSKPLVNDLFLNLVFGILIGAVGMGIIFNQNSSTGGTDIVAKILNKYLNLEIGKALLITDFIITLFALFTFGPLIGMYSLLGVVMNGFIVDYIIEGFNILKKVEIVSNKGDEIKRFIMEDLDRGATLYYAKGAYTLENKEVITTVLDKKEFIKLKNFIKEIDPQAFVMIYNVHETLGNGFNTLQ